MPASQAHRERERWEKMKARRRMEVEGGEKQEEDRKGDGKKEMQKRREWKGWSDKRNAPRAVLSFLFHLCVLISHSVKSGLNHWVGFDVSPYSFHPIIHPSLHFFLSFSHSHSPLHYSCVGCNLISQHTDKTTHTHTASSASPSLSYIHSQSHTQIIHILFSQQHTL